MTCKDKIACGMVLRNQNVCWNETHLPWNMKKVLRRYPFEILCGNWSLPYTGWEKPKKQIFPSANTEISQFQNMASIKTNKIKKRRHFIISTFENLQLCFFVQKDSATLKVLKMQFVFGWAYDKGHCIFNLQCSLLWLSQRQIAFLGPLEWRNLFGQKSKVVSFQKLI